MEIEKIAPIVIALVASIPGVLAFLAQRKKDDNEMEKAVRDAAIALVTPLREEVDRLRKQVCEMEAILRQKDDRIKELQASITDRDKRIDELEGKVAFQEKEMTRQQKEIDALQKKSVNRKGTA